MALDIRPLTPDRIPDLATLFDQGGDPKWCWCTYFRVRGRDWSNSTAAENRASSSRRPPDGTTRRSCAGPRRVPGRDGRRLGQPRLRARTTSGWPTPRSWPRSTTRRSGRSCASSSVARSRGQGVADALLDAAIAYARDHGATILEAYPVDVPDGERIPSANAYQGTL